MLSFRITSMIEEEQEEGERREACWLAGWLAGSLAGWLAGLLGGWLAGGSGPQLHFLTSRALAATFEIQVGPIWSHLGRPMLFHIWLILLAGWNMLRCASACSIRWGSNRALVCHSAKVVTSAASKPLQGRRDKGGRGWSEEDGGTSGVKKATP